MFQAVVLHHPVPEHRVAFTGFMYRVIEAMRDVLGLIEFTAWDTQTGPLVAISRWESPDVFEAAMPTILSLGPERHPEWSDRDDDLFLTSPA